jgi:5-formyltetrahydrofolate cyclo-ligase
MTAQAGSASSPLPPGTAAAQSAARRALRKQMREARQRLTRRQRRDASLAIAQSALRAGLLKSGLKVAAYVAVRHEADLAVLMARARAIGCRLYLPRVSNQRTGRMEFHRFAGLRNLKRSSLGLLEPACTAPRLPPRELDRVFVPLSAFDAAGRRLGTGGGFYDRRFAWLARGRSWRKPRLVGVGYEVQRVPRVPAEPWDVVMDAIVTERGVLRRQHC